MNHIQKPVRILSHDSVFIASMILDCLQSIDQFQLCNHEMTAKVATLYADDTEYYQICLAHTHSTISLWKWRLFAIIPDKLHTTNGFHS